VLIGKWIRKFLEERKRRRMLDEYDEIVRSAPPLWKSLGFADQRSFELSTLQVLGLEGDSFYMATKCPDGSWVVWEDLSDSFCRNHIAFGSWQEAALFLREEATRMEESWIPHLFGFPEGRDPFVDEPDFGYYREVWKDVWDEDE
jgi:hypothetical protein